MPEPTGTSGRGTAAASAGHARVAPLLAAVSAGSAIAVFGIGCLVLVGWVFDSAVLKSVHPNWISMKANTAVAFILTGIALWLSQAKRRDVRWGRYVAWGCASVVAGVGLVTLLEYASGWNLGINQLLFTDPRGGAQAVSPGRPAPNTASTLLLIGLALVLLDVETRRGHRPAQYLIVLEGIVALVALVGYLYGASSFYAPSPAANPMSLPAAVAGVVAFIGLGVARPGPGLLTFFAGESAGSIMARRFVLPVVLVPVLVDLLLLAGEHAGLYGGHLAPAVHVVLLIAFFLGLVWVTAASLDRLDAERRRAEKGIAWQNAVQEGINRIFREALRCDTEEDLGRVCLAVVEEVTQSKFGFMGEVSAAGRLDNIAISNPGWDACTMEAYPGHPKAPTSLKIHGLYGRVLLDGKGFFTNDPASHPDSIGLPQGHPPLEAFLGVPLVHGAKTIGMIGLGNREGGYRNEDLEALESLSVAMVQALMRKRAEEALRKAHDELETRVQQRTAELQKTSEALAAERQRFQEVLDQLPAYLVLLSPDYRVPFANRFFEERFGRSNGKRCFEYLFQRTEPCENCETYKVLKTGAPHRWEWTGPDVRNYDIYDFPFTDVDGSPLIMEVGLDVTERKRAEGELQKHRDHLEELVQRRTSEVQAAHAQLQTIFENVDEGVVVAGLDGQLTHWNRAALEMHGFANLDEARRRLSEFVDTFELAGLDGEVWPVDQWPLARILRGEHLRDLEVRIRRVTSDWERVFRYGGTLVRDAKGQPLLAVVTLSDITERKRAEEALRESREDLDRAQAVGQIGSWRLDIHRNVLTWSDENHRLFGVRKGTPLTYERFLEMVHPEDREHVDRQWKAGLRGEPYDVEHRIVVDGQVKWVREKAYLEFDDAGKLLGGFGITQDITERKRAEEALRRSAQFPEENPNPVLRIAGDGGLMYANAAARACLAAMGHAADQPLPAGVQSLVAGAVRQEQGVEAELDDERGCTYWFLAAQPPGERYVNLYGREITERKRAEEAQRRTAEELARSNKDLEQFAYVASHDLQEPLRVVTGHLQLIERRYKDRIDADANDFIHFAVDGAARMQQLISDLLDYSRVGTQGRPFAPTNLETVLDTALLHLQVVIGDTGAVVTRDPLPTVEADELQWIRLLQNLIGNAIKYRGERRPEIHVSARQDQGRWVFSVGDNGIGIEPQYWEKIFAIFQRLHTRQKYPGTGIGLAICKRIVERHGGRIWLESQPGQGTTFYWTI